MVKYYEKNRKRLVLKRVHRKPGVGRNQVQKNMRLKKKIRAINIGNGNMGAGNSVNTAYTTLSA